MGERSKIEWTDHTFNPWTGCQKVSPGCDNCYAEGWAKRSGLVEWGPGKGRRRTSPGYWKQPIKWNRQAERDGVRRKVFCASLADVFDNAVPEEWRRDLFALIADTPHLDWLLLTKRPQNAWEMIQAAIGAFDQNNPWPWLNVWLGTTAENQTEADRRIPHLLAVPAAKRFLSCEPLLGPLDLHLYLDPLRLYRRHIDWVICGGESGPNARPMHPDWARSLRDQCAAAGVPFHFKQFGEYGTASIDMRTNAPVFREFHTFTEWVNKASTRVRTDSVCLDTDGNILRRGEHFMPARDGERFPVIIMDRIGKKRAGALLDGREHREFPA